MRLQKDFTTHSAISRSLALSIWMRRSEHAFNRLCASCLQVTNTPSCCLHITSCNTCLLSSCKSLPVI